MENLVHYLFNNLILHNLQSDNTIPVNLRDYRTTGTVQDDPFDEWASEKLQRNDNDFKVFHSGKLSSPDIVVGNISSKKVIGLEVKKLDANKNGKDPRGLTLDYNSTVPCGRQDIKIDGQIHTVPVFYFFALVFEKKITTSVTCDGDFLNSNYQLHKDSKTSNESTYNHGSYGEASIRHRKMYNFPNPLNSNISIFANHHCLITKSNFIKEDPIHGKKPLLRKTIERENVDGYVQLYDCFSTNTQLPNSSKDLFLGCKDRTAKKRSAYIVSFEF